MTQKGRYPWIPSFLLPFYRSPVRKQAEISPLQSCNIPLRQGKRGEGKLEGILQHRFLPGKIVRLVQRGAVIPGPGFQKQILIHPPAAQFRSTVIEPVCREGGGRGEIDVSTVPAACRLGAPVVQLLLGQRFRTDLQTAQRHIPRLEEKLRPPQRVFRIEMVLPAVGKGQGEAVLPAGVRIWLQLGKPVHSRDSAVQHFHPRYIGGTGRGVGLQRGPGEEEEEVLRGIP